MKQRKITNIGVSLTYSKIDWNFWGFQYTLSPPTEEYTAPTSKRILHTRKKQTYFKTLR